MPYRLAIIILTVAAAALPTTTLASCRPFLEGSIQRYNRTMDGTERAIAITTYGQVIKVLNPTDCTLVAKKRFSNATTPKHQRLVVGNLWQDPGPADAGEIVVAERLSSTTLKLRIFQFTDDVITRIAKRTVTVVPGQATLTIRDKTVRINGTAYQLVTWKGQPRLAQVDSSLQFFALGDQGLAGADQDAVAASMNQLAHNRNGINFVATLGDNFYPENAITSVTDSDWETAFLTPYGLTDLTVPFYVALGNHDYDDNDVTALLDYDDTSGKWNLPNEYYVVDYPADSATPVLRYIVLDTEMIDAEAGGYAEQLTWLESQLTDNPASWTIVAGHHPAYSYGVHGDTGSIQANVLPLLRQYDVDVYLTGHDHDKQVIDRPEDDIVYVISGTGSRLRDTSSGAYTDFAASTLGFTAVTILPHELELLMIDTSGATEYRTTLQK